MNNQENNIQQRLTKYIEREIEYKDQPVGYGQTYQMSGEMFEEYDYPDDGKVVYAMDQFIGEPAFFLTRIKVIPGQYAPIKKLDSES